MGTPANHTGDRKDRCEELRRQIQHTVYKSAVEVHVGTDTFVDLAFFGNDLWCKAFHHRIKLELFFSAFFFGKFLYETLENIGTRIRKRVNSMSHTIDQTGVIESVFVQQGTQIITNFFFVVPVFDGFLHIFKHTDNFDVGTAVFRTF